MLQVVEERKGVDLLKILKSANTVIPCWGAQFLLWCTHLHLHVHNQVCLSVNVCAVYIGSVVGMCSRVSIFAAQQRAELAFQK
jgi:hypothetical protein